MNRKSPNRLDRATERKLEDLLVDHAEEINKGKWTRQSFAKYASRRLGRPVTSGNVSGASRTFDHIQFCGGPASGSLKNLRQLNVSIGVLARELTHLKGEMGLTVSPILAELAELANGNEQE